MTFGELFERNFGKWFDTFLEEKDLPHASWDLTSPDGTLHCIDSDVVVEQIKHAPTKEKAGIKDMLVKIDFVNGDVNDYFKHLAQALVNNY